MGRIANQVQQWRLNVDVGNQQDWDHTPKPMLVITIEPRLEDGSYQYTLDNLWDVSLTHLSSDVTLLLEFVYFLDPYQLPVSFFIGPDDGSNASAEEWQNRDIDRFDAAISLLCERHLVERYSQADLDVLRTYRALQRSTLQRLDEALLKNQSRSMKLSLLRAKLFQLPISLSATTPLGFRILYDVLQVLSVLQTVSSQIPRSRALSNLPPFSVTQGFTVLHNKTRQQRLYLRKPANKFALPREKSR
ncbi:hypothetical protein F5Y18DRAFT_16105 [Xylariaceae sp. FL1019]|nr:hypothetical protein F5Y18DRAFT_16105 [Xylariaceae sp. FL1019]